jgi:hypothetical protein
LLIGLNKILHTKLVYYTINGIIDTLSIMALVVLTVPPDEYLPNITGRWARLDLPAVIEIKYQIKLSLLLLFSSERPRPD